MKKLLSTTLLLSSIAAAEPLGSSFTYQGELTQANQAAQGEFDLQFSLYDAVADGLPISTQILDNVPVQNGIFSVKLDFGDGVFIGDRMWVEVAVREGDSSAEFTSLLPRQPVSATPYALHAEMVAMDAVSGTEIIDNSVTSAELAPDSVGFDEIDTASVQARIADPCPAGSSISGVNDDGTVSCLDQPWVATASGINYSAGTVGLGVADPDAALHVADNGSVLFGASFTGSGDKLMFIPELHAFRVGSLASGASSEYWNEANVGPYSFASGLNNRAQGFAGTAMGRNTEAEGDYGFATGYFTNADGLYSTSMGFNTIASGLGSTAVGYSTNAEGSYATSLGFNTQAQSFASTVLGRYNVGGGSATSWQSSDPLFEVGIGTSSGNRSNAMTIRKNGNVGIGTTVPLDALHVAGRIRLQTVEFFEDGGTSEIAARGDLRPTSDNIYDLGTSALRYDDVFATSGVVNTSDRRAKKNIAGASYGLEQVMRLDPVSFHYTSDADSSPFRMGFVAQDVLEVIPEVVKTHNWEQDEETGELFEVELERLGIYYSSLIPVLVKAIQEQQAQIDSLKKRLERP